ncbi:MAG: hypothetical protein QM770_15000 [Tepidisphaeraceae bacterium]
MSESSSILDYSTAPVARRYSSPPSVIDMVVALGGTIVFLIGAPSPLSSVPWMMAGAAILFVAAMLWLMRGILFVRDWRALPDLRPLLQRKRWRWGVLPALLLFITVSWSVDLTTRIRFEFARGRLTALAQQYQPTPVGVGTCLSDSDVRQRVGSFLIQSLQERRPSEIDVVLQSDHDEIVAFTWSPTTRPTHQSAQARCITLGGGWYLVREAQEP